jgi:hypothetical protein
LKTLIWSRNMTARIVYFGEDTCHRLSVLKRTGYFVADCKSLEQLHTTLQFWTEADAVLMADDNGDISRDAIALTRSRSSALLILFRDSNRDDAESDFDWVVPVLTPPSNWLKDIAALIELRRMRRSAERLPAPAYENARRAARLTVFGS